MNFEKLVNIALSGSNVTTDTFKILVIHAKNFVEEWKEEYKEEPPHAFVLYDLNKVIDSMCFGY